MVTVSTSCASPSGQSERRHLCLCAQRAFCLLKRNDQACLAHRLESLWSFQENIILLLALLLGPMLAQPVNAIGGVDAAPSPAPAHEITFTHPKETKLDNGLRVIVAERPSLPLLAIELIIRSGSERDPNDRAGVASMTGSY